MRIRLPERLSLVDLILWGLRVAIIVFVSDALTRPRPFARSGKRSDG
jgi:hypothetical protein